MKNFPISGDGQALTATAASSAQALSGPAERVTAAPDVLIYNPGPLAIHVRTGAADVVATAQSMLVPPNALQAFAKGNTTHIAALSESGDQDYTVWLGEGFVFASFAGPRGDVLDGSSGRQALVVYEDAPPGFSEQQKALTVISPPDYVTAAASQADAALGATGGAAGDWLDELIIVVATAATAAVSVKDGSGSAISVFPNSPGGGIGTYRVPGLGASKNGPWKVTTGAGVSVIARGRFS